MAKFALTISADYVKDWTLYEGLREILQNAIDGYPMQIDYSSADGGTLTVTNVGAKLSRSIWLLGETTKTADSHIGCYGEGAKLGSLAIIRAGYSIVMRNDDESWFPALEPSDAFPDRTVLTVRTRAAAPTGNFSVAIKGVSSSDWETTQRCFLRLNPHYKPPTGDAKPTERLDHPSFKGQLFVRGILVSTDLKLSYGYNFASGVNTDRDRKMVSPYVVKNAMGLYWSWQAQTADQPLLIDQLKADAPDIEEVYSYLNVKESDALKGAFLTENGEKAWPCRDLLEAQRLEHYGLTPVVVSRAFHRVLTRAGLEMETAAKAHKTEITDYISADSLNRVELAVYCEALELVATASAQHGLPDPHKITQIARFSDPDTQGLHVRKDGEETIVLSRAILTSLPKTLQVLVHEVAHHVGNDGDVTHERMEGQIFADMVCGVLQAA